LGNDEKSLKYRSEQRFLLFYPISIRRHFVGRHSFKAADRGDRRLARRISEAPVLLAGYVLGKAGQLGPMTDREVVNT